MHPEVQPRPERGRAAARRGDRRPLSVVSGPRAAAGSGCGRATRCSRRWASSMEQELERIFRVMALLLPHAGLHDAYVGLRSSNPDRARQRHRVPRQRAQAGAAAAAGAAARQQRHRRRAHRAGRTSWSARRSRRPSRRSSRCSPARTPGCARAPSTRSGRCSSRASKGSWPDWSDRPILRCAKTSRPRGAAWHPSPRMGLRPRSRCQRASTPASAQGRFRPETSAPARRSLCTASLIRDTRCQTSPRLSADRRGIDDRQERIDDRRIELAVALPLDLGERIADRPRRPCSGRFCVSASKTSAIATMRPASGMALPTSPS